MIVIHCPLIKGEGGRLIFISSPRRWVSNAAVLALVFNNGWIMTLLEHMTARSQSAAD
jgi:hypothetical protein